MGLSPMNLKMQGVHCALSFNNLILRCIDHKSLRWQRMSGPCVLVKICVWRAKAATFATRSGHRPNPLSQAGAKSWKIATLTRYF
jgi:tRNA (Thr-GGU) A37 N-methylase